MAMIQGGYLQIDPSIRAACEQEESPSSCLEAHVAEVNPRLAEQIDAANSAVGGGPAGGIVFYPHEMPSFMRMVEREVHIPTTQQMRHARDHNWMMGNRVKKHLGELLEKAKRATPSAWQALEKEIAHYGELRDNYKRWGNIWNNELKGAEAAGKSKK